MAGIAPIPPGVRSSTVAALSRLPRSGLRACLTVGMIRDVRTTDFEEMIAIERAAGEAFRSIGMARIADDPPPTVEQMARFLESGTGWVDTDPDDRAVAYLLLEKLDERAHIEQVTVHPRYARRRIGAALIERAKQWADDRGLVGLSLTTFAEVPWNAPHYASLGFVVLPQEEWTAGLRSRAAAETAQGLDAWPRVVMIR